MQIHGQFLRGSSVSFSLCDGDIGRDSFRRLFNVNLFTTYWSIQHIRGSMMIKKSMVYLSMYSLTVWS